MKFINSYVSPTPKFQPLPFSLTRTKILWTHTIHATNVKVWLMAPMNPRTHTTRTPLMLFSRLVKLMWTAKTMVYYSGIPPNISLENIQEFEILFWMVASKRISTQQKYFQSWQYSQKNIAAIDVIFMSLLWFLEYCFAWKFRSSRSKGFYGNGALKTS